MSFPPENLPDIPPEIIAEVKAFLRIDHDADDMAIDGFVRSAFLLCENFTAQTLITRSFCDMLPARSEWMKIMRLPVQSITLVEGIASDGGVTPIEATSYAMDIDSDGHGWIKLHQPVTISRIRVTYQAGLAAEWDNVPRTLREGIVRLAGYLYANRDGVDAGGPPSAVTALWRPHRRMRLT